MKMLKEKQEKGITLIVLVITIIIIIILSMVTINVVLGDSGLVKQASTSKDSSTNMIETENEKMNQLIQEYTNIMSADNSLSEPIVVKIHESHTTENITIEVENSSEDLIYEFYIDGELKVSQKEPNYTMDVTLEGKEPYLPSGFKHTEGTVDTGYVIQDISNNNEFVWIPVKGKTYTAYVVAKDKDGNTGRSEEIKIDISELTREINGMTYDQWKEEEGNVNDKKSIAYFKQSVEKNRGFYMGRYEMGMPGQISGGAPTLNISYEEQNVSGVPVCIERAIPWINIDWSIAKANEWGGKELIKLY